MKSGHRRHRYKSCDLLHGQKLIWVKTVLMFQDFLVVHACKLDDLDTHHRGELCLPRPQPTCLLAKKFLVSQSSLWIKRLDLMSNSLSTGVDFKDGWRYQIW